MRLKIGSSNIPIDPGTSLALVLRSPLFDNSDGKTPGSFIFNPKLPATPELSEEFEQAHRPSRNGRATAELPFAMEQGSLRYSGTSSVQEADSKAYETLLKIRNGDFAAEVSEKTLKDLDLGGDRAFSTGPYSIATNTESIEINDFRNTGNWTLEQILAINKIIVDFTNSLTISNTTFTVPSTTTYKSKIILDVGITYGQIFLQIFKNSVILLDVELLNGVNIIENNWSLQTDDVIEYKLFAYSGNDLANNDVIYFAIAKDFFIEMRTDDSLFIDVASGDQSTFDYTVFPIENPNFFDNFPKDEFKIDNVNIQQVYSENFFVQNYWKDGHFPYMLSGEKNGDHTFAMNIFTPFVYIKYLLDQIAADLNYELIDSPFVTDSPYFNAVLYNAFAENTYLIDDARMINVKPTFNLVDHVPETPIATFLNSLCKITGRRIDIDTEMRTITFVRLRTVIESTANVPFPGIITESPIVIVAPEYKGFKIELKAGSDKYISERIKAVNPKYVDKGSVSGFSGLPATGNTVNDRYLVESTNELIVWKYSTELYRLAWGFYSKNFFLTREYGEAPYLEISCDMAPVIDHRILDETVGAPANRTWIIPVSWQAGNFEGFPDMSAEYGMQLLFFKGLQMDSNYEEYPLAITGKKNVVGSTFLNPNLCVDGLQPNTFTEELQAWLEWLVFSTKPVKLKAVMTPSQLRSINYATKYRILGNTYLIKEIRVNIVNDHLSEAEIEAYTC